MKLFNIILFSLLLVQCTTSGKGTNSSPGVSHTSESDVTLSKNKYNDLSTLLQSLNGVSVTGYGIGAKVTVRGSEGNSFYGTTEPLFILNGTRVSRGYSELYASVDVNRIIEIKVLKGSEAAVYGSSGGNGVIIISTK